MQRLVMRKLKIFMLAVLCAFSVVSVTPIYQPTVIEAKDEYQDDGIAVNESKVQEAIDYYKKYLVSGNTVKWDKADNKITIINNETGEKQYHTGYSFCKMVKDISTTRQDDPNFKADKPFEFTKNDYIEAKYNHDGVFEKIVVALYDGKFKLVILEPLFQHLSISIT